MIGQTAAARRLPPILAATLLLLASCVPPPPPVFEKLAFGYLTKIKLDVGSIETDDSWTPRGSLRQVGFLAPTPPVAALRSMAEDRLIPGGTGGHAVFVIDDASVVLFRSRFEGSFAVHLDLFDAEDKPVGTATATVRGARMATDDTDADAVRRDLDALVRKMMADMNIEFEFQVRSTLKERLQATSVSAPAPDGVDAQELELPAQP